MRAQSSRRLHSTGEHLRQEVEAWREEARRKDAILMTMAQRIPELESPPEVRDSSVRASEEPLSTPDAPSDPQEQEPSQSRSWLHRFFFGPG